MYYELLVHLNSNIPFKNIFTVDFSELITLWENNVYLDFILSCRLHIFYIMDIFILLIS